MTSMLASMYLSTQFFMQGSSLRSSAPCEIRPVIHLVKQVELSAWIAIAHVSLDAQTYLKG